MRVQPFSRQHGAGRLHGSTRLVARLSRFVIGRAARRTDATDPMRGRAPARQPGERLIAFRHVLPDGLAETFGP
ncbi:hypothetical protein [Burkholderia sp. PU8-34]